MWQLYKYQPINKLVLSNLAQDKLWASHAAAFNDPFEFRLQKSGMVKGLDSIRKQNPHLDDLSDFDLIKQATGKYEKELAKMSIVCFTAIPNNILMWAHYADSFKGFCLGFSGKDDETDLGKLGIYKVNYQQKYCEKDFAKIWHKDGLANIIWTKYKAWEYETEYRLVMLQENQLVDYPGTLNRIIFGFRASNEDIRLVRSILQEKSNIEYCKIVQHDDRYELLVEVI